MKILIRKMKLTDISQCTEINCEMLTENYERDFWLQTFNEGKAFSYVAVWAGSIIGYILCRRGMVISFAVLSRYHGKGIGTALMQCVLDTHPGNITLNARVSNTGAVKLYQRLGFSIVRTVPAYYHGETPEDAYEMCATATGEGKIKLPLKINIALE